MVKRKSATRLSQFSAGDTPVSPASNGWLGRRSSSVRLSIGGRKWKGDSTITVGENRKKINLPKRGRLVGAVWISKQASGEEDLMMISGWTKRLGWCPHD
jgi:hypothetical protein